MHRHFDRHRLSTLLLSGVIVLGGLGIIHNAHLVADLVKESWPDDGFSVALVGTLHEAPQPAQVGGFIELFNAAAVSWYETVCSVIRICNN